MKHIKTAFEKFFGIFLLLFAFGMLILQTNNGFVSATEIDFPELPDLPILTDIPTPPITINPCDCQDNTPTPTNTPVPTETPSPTPTEEVPSPTPTTPVEQEPSMTPTPTEEIATPTPTQTPTPTEENHDDGDDDDSPSVGGIVSSSNPVGGSSDSNPLIEGIKGAYGKTLGTTTKKLPKTGDADGKSESLPTGNQLIENSFLYIPKIGINKALYQGQTIGDEMLVGGNEILQAGDDSNKVFYAHNTNTEFGKLRQLTAGDAIFYTDNGMVHTYIVQSVAKVSATNIQVLENNNEKVITLISCDLYNESLRVVVKAELQ